MSILRSIVLAMICVAVAGCGSAEKRSEPKESSTQFHKKLGTSKAARLDKFVEERRRSTSLAVPPDLLESSNDAIVQNHANNQKSQARDVLPDVVGASIVNDGSNRWLEVETSASQVWKTLADYWAQEQVSLVEFNAAAGIMETDWIEEGAEERTGARGLAKALFSRITGQGISHDKYAIRLEKKSAEMTRVFVSHRATVKKEQTALSGRKLSNFDWVQVADDPDKVAQLLQLMVLLFDTSDLDSV